MCLNQCTAKQILRSKTRITMEKEDFLFVSELFHSIQGEGIHAGRSAFFIRLSGCSINCPWCDTKYSWRKEDGHKMSIHEIKIAALEARRDGAEFAVITGGEPLEQNITSLCNSLKYEGVKVHIETSGHGKWSGSYDWVCVSPKRLKQPNKESLRLCNELKVIVSDKSDLSFADEIARQTLQAQSGNKICSWFILQPEWDNRQGLECCIDYARKNTLWRLGLQIHKYAKIK